MSLYVVRSMTGIHSKDFSLVKAFFYEEEAKDYTIKLNSIVQKQQTQAEETNNPKTIEQFSKALENSLLPLDPNVSVVEGHIEYCYVEVPLDFEEDDDDDEYNAN